MSPTPGSVIVFILLGLAAASPALAQNDFHQTKFPEKPEIVYKAAVGALTLRHTKKHWVNLRDDEHLELHFQTKGTMNNVGYRMVLTVKPDGDGSTVEIDSHRIEIAAHGLQFGNGKKEIEMVFHDMAAELQADK